MTTAVLKKYKLVIFDWDGTVMDSISKIVNCIRTVRWRLILSRRVTLQLKILLVCRLNLLLRCYFLRT
ncbi:hypothetical protein F0Z19_1144 [Vibrio cyclitrophicus]|nr:hypothetical protein F0Z19_1144 [Vibrio cyclitrophicus]